MSSAWIDTRIDRIFTHVKSEVINDLGSTYKDLNFTTDDSENTDAKFPTVYMFFDWTERMSTLDGGVINGVYMTIRTQVSAQNNANGIKAVRKVNARVRDELCRLGFITSGSPIPTRSGDVKIINSNYQRVIGNDDPLII